MVHKEDCVKAGKIIKTHNLDGKVVVAVENDLLEKYSKEPVFLFLEGAPVPFFIAENGVSVRNHTSLIVKFDYVDSPTQAERLLGEDVFIRTSDLNEEDLSDFDEDDFDIFDLEGFKVKDSLSGDEGNVEYITDYSGNIVMTVILGNKEILIPFAPDYITYVDPKLRTITLQIPQELRDLD
ncbi:MAG: ribosome maturation factor RimM [Culturomica sp.]|jgi:16S rRNA processing protein RimM|nr:ribosome maturation factor RimM [Culturomica sp.]